MAGVDERAAWERLARLLDDDELLWPRVRQALDGGSDPAEALLDGLDDAGVLAYLDAEDTGMELADALAQLPRVFRLRLDLGEVTDTDDLRSAMSTADALLAGAGSRLLLLPDADEDAYALVVVAEGDVPEILTLSAGLKRPIVTFR